MRYDTRFVTSAPISALYWKVDGETFSQVRATMDWLDGLTPYYLSTVKVVTTCKKTSTDKITWERQAHNGERHVDTLWVTRRP